MKKEQIERDFEKYQLEKKQNINNNKNINFIEMRKKIRPLFRKLLFVQRILNKQTIEIISDQHIQENRGIVFAVSHIGKYDFEMVNEVLKEHFYVIASDYRNMHGNSNEFFLNLNGVIFVNELSKEDKYYSKKMMEKILLNNDNIMIFPEGTWNISENEIIMDTHLGAVAISLSTNSIIVPIAIEQYDKNFKINIGKNFDPTKYVKDILNIDYSLLNENNDKELIKKIQIEVNKVLRDEMATLKYEIWATEPITIRNTIPDDYWPYFINDRVNEWPGYSMSEQIDSVVHTKEKKEYEEVQKTLNLLKRKK